MFATLPGHSLLPFTAFSHGTNALQCTNQSHAYPRQIRQLWKRAIVTPVAKLSNLKES